jgi:AcrR family transcriptional regulator
MSPRRYDRTLRQAASEEARRRIVEAAAALHARHGGLGTSHAMIAREAGVSVPTVYKYFPTREALIPACTGLVAGRAPLALDSRIFDGLRRVPDRIRALVRSVFRLHAYLAPWSRWSERDAAGIPALEAVLGEWRKGRLELLRLALRPPGDRPPPEPLVRVAHALLEFPAWRILTENGRTSEQAAEEAADALIALYLNHSKRKENA